MFKFVNMGMIVFFICAMCMNYVGVNVRGTNAATSSINGNNFEYTVLDNSLDFKRNGNLIGSLPMDKKMYIRNDNLLSQSNAIVVVAKAAAAAAAGASFGAAVVDGIINIIGPGAFAAAAESMALPGAAAVEATLAGAGEAAAAAAADAAIAAGGVGALMSAFVVPVLIAAGVGAGIM